MFDLNVLLINDLYSYSLPLKNKRKIKLRTNG